MKIQNLLEQYYLIENYKLARQEFSQKHNSDEVIQMLDIFKNRQARITDPEQKDINYWRKRGWNAFKQFVISIDQHHDSKRARRNKVKASSNEILTVKKTADMHLFIPLSKGASCFYGSGTPWCVSTRDGDNYFTRYTSIQGLVIFFMIYRDDIFALVIDPQFGHVVESQDVSNDGKYPSSTFLNNAGMSKQDVLSFINRHKDVIESSYKDSAKNAALSSPKDAYDYAYNIIKDRFPEGERMILTSPKYSYRYATDILGERWKAAEKIISTSATYSRLYAYRVLKNRFLEAESTIAKSPENAVAYAESVIKGRFPEAENAIITDAEYSYKYAREVVKDRFPEGEPVIAKDSVYAVAYAIYVIKGRFPEAEPTIARSNDVNLMNMYSRESEEHYNALLDIWKADGILPNFQ